jgi:hypothetical protein
MIRKATTAISAQQASTVSQAQRGRSAGRMVARGSTYVVKVSRVMTSPPTSRFARVATTPNGATSQCVLIPATISSACSSTDIAT